MSIQEITPEQAIALFQKENALFIDVRDPLEHENQRIPGSVLHPLGTISSQHLPKTENYLIYCQKGVRGKKACEKIHLDSPDIALYNVKGGIEAWQNAGLITQSTGNTRWAVKQQINIMIGLIILCFSLLSLLYSEKFIYILVLIGSLFVLTGFKDIGIMPKLLAKMPWNKQS